MVAEIRDLWRQPKRHIPQWLHRIIAAAAIAPYTQLSIRSHPRRFLHPTPHPTHAPIPHSLLPGQTQRIVEVVKGRRLQHQWRHLRSEKPRNLGPAHPSRHPTPKDCKEACQCFAAVSLQDKCFFLFYIFYNNNITKQQNALWAWKPFGSGHRLGLETLRSTFFDLPPTFFGLLSMRQNTIGNNWEIYMHLFVHFMP